MSSEYSESFAFIRVSKNIEELSDKERIYLPNFLKDVLLLLVERNLIVEPNSKT